MESKYEKLKRNILEDIQSGSLSPGDQIPPQREMEEVYGVSRITVKKAVADLIQEGVLEHLKGKKGVFVRKQSAFFNGGSKTIAVALDDITSFYDSNLLKGIEDCLWKQDYHTIICNANRNIDKVEEYFRSFDFTKIDGIIYLPVVVKGYEERNRRILEIFKEKAVPFVLIDQYISGEPANLVSTDHRNAAKEICRALIEQGHRNILVGKGVDCFAVDERIYGIMDAHRAADLSLGRERLLEINDNLLVPGRDPNPEQLERIKDLIRSAGDFTAFYAINNRVMKAVVLAMVDLGLDMDRIQLALHNEVNKPVHPYTDNIPHIIPHLHKIGLEAANLLMKVIETGDDQTVQLIINSDVVLNGLKN
jgi:GntR family transcriptional regulator of arabinose operon